MITFAIFAGLWIVLALMVLVVGIEGEMPRWAAVLAVFLVPLAGVGALTALVHVVVDHYFSYYRTLIVVALLPPLIAFYAIWARLPQLRAALPPQPTSVVTCTLIFICRWRPSPFGLQTS